LANKFWRKKLTKVFGQKYELANLKEGSTSTVKKGNWNFRLVSQKQLQLGSTKAKNHQNKTFLAEPISFVGKVMNL